MNSERFITVSLTPEVLQLAGDDLNVYSGTFGHGINLRLLLHVLHQLDLPEDFSPEHAWDDYARRQVRVLIGSSRFSLVEEGTFPPDLSVDIRYDDGVKQLSFKRWQEVSGG